MQTKEKWAAIYRAYSDGCSSSPDFNFTACCDEHDYYYATHETIDEQPISRKEADRRLRKCIQAHWGGLLLPWIYWAAVRLFGGKHYE